MNSEGPYITLENRYGPPIIFPRFLSIIKGGPGSGHFGHRGRPGKRGGSAPAVLEPITGLPFAMVLTALKGEVYPNPDAVLEGWEIGAFGQHRLAQTVDGDIYVMEKEPWDEETREEMYDPRDISFLQSFVLPGRGLAGREVATSRLAEEMGWGDYVPLTALDHATNTVSRATFVTDANGSLEWPQFTSQRAGFVMDCLAGQADRHAGNILYSPKVGAYQFIDNELSFPIGPPDHTPFDVYRGQYGRMAEPPLADVAYSKLDRGELERIGQLEDSKRDTYDELVYLVGKDATDALYDRVGYALTTKLVPLHPQKEQADF